MCDRRLGAHTLAFGTYLAMMAGGLTAVRSIPLATLFTAMLVALGWLVSRRNRTYSDKTLRHELAFYPIAMNISFEAMGGAIPAIRSHRYDETLLGIDLHLFGTSPNVWLEQFVTPPLTELFSLCYLLFMPLLAWYLIRYFFRQKAFLGEFYSGLFTLYGVGFVGYLLVPAAGPYLAFPSMFSVPLDGGPITALTRDVVLLGSNRVDVFPSLHCAVSAYILGFAWRHHRREFWLLLIPVSCLWVSTIYLRYHYFVDVICGFVLALLCLTRCRNPYSPLAKGVRNEPCS